MNEVVPLVAPSLLDLPMLEQSQVSASALSVVIERRYLGDIDRTALRLSPEDSDSAVPILRQVRAIGRRSMAEVAAASMHSLLAACHNPSHDLVAVLHGDGARHQLFYGLRRRAGGGSFENGMAGLEGAFRAQMPGLTLGEAAPLRAGGHAGLADFLAGADAFASITGIPSERRGATPGARLALDQVISAMGNRPYALMIVAEPLPIAVVEEAMSACRRLMSDLHPMISGSVSRTRGENTGVTESAGRNESSLVSRVGPSVATAVSYGIGFGLMGLAAPAMAVLTPGITAATMALTHGGAGGRTTSNTSTSGRSNSESQTLSLLDADADYCSKLVEAHHSRLSGARGGGWWRTAVYVAAEDEIGLHAATQALRGAAVGEATHLEPIRVQRPPAHMLREAMQHGRLLRLEGPRGEGQHPLGAAHEALATCINSDELAVIVSPPRAEAPGISMLDRGQFSLTAPRVDGQSVRLGALVDGAGETLDEIQISARALNEHALVVGMPGSGKTNTCMRLLLEANARLGVPFLVIEPAKSEYRRLAQEPSLKDRLRVYSVGGDGGGTLRLNPLRPVPGVPLMGHIELLKSVFNASFSMFPGMEQILEQALIEVYEERGWNLDTSRNEAAPPDTPIAALEALLPTLSDLHDQIEDVLRRRNYGEEVRRNLGAALSSRLGSLRLGAKGLVLDTRRSTPLEDLFQRPVVLELNHLRDDEEKSFVMALVLALLYQYAEARQAYLPSHRREALQHITLIEEAHRLLAASGRGGGPEVGDPRGKGVAIFANMLAELRALGEGFIVAEQIPTKLASDVLKNTNLKIIHRLSAPADCRVLGESANLEDDQLRYLVSLPMGTAVVHGLTGRAGDVVSGAVLTRVASVKDALTAAAGLGAAAPHAPAHALFRLGGCESCSDPCAFYAGIQRIRGGSAGRRAFRAVAEAVMLGRPDDAATAFAAWRRTLAGADPGEGRVFCAFLHAADAWLTAALTARGVLDELSGRRIMRPADRLLSESLSEAFGVAGAALVSGGDATAALAALSAALNQALADPQATAGLPACERCPSPCRALAFVAGRGVEALAADLAAARLPNQRADAFGNPVNAGLFWDKVSQALQRADAPAFAEADGVRAFAYCQLAHVPMPPALDDFRADLLARV